MKVNSKEFQESSGELQLKIRESGMRKEEEWTPFFDPFHALNIIGLNHSIANVADLVVE